MGIVIDIALVAVAVLIIRSGYKNGIVKGIFNLASVAVSAVLAFAFSPGLARVIYDRFVIGRISEGVGSTVASLSKTSDGYDISKLFSEASEVFTSMLQKYSVDEGALKNAADTIGETGEAAVEKISEFIAAPTATVVSNVAAFIIVFIAAFILLKILSAIIASVFKAPVLRSADRLAGIIVGAVCAFAVVWILSSAIALGLDAMGAVAPKWFGSDVVDRSLILRFFSRCDPFSLVKNALSYKG